MYGLKSYEQWIREDAKDLVKIILMGSLLIAFFCAVCGVVFIIIIVFVRIEQSPGTILNPADWATYITWGMAGMFYIIHEVTDTLLKKAYRKYKSQKLHG